MKRIIIFIGMILVLFLSCSTQKTVKSDSILKITNTTSDTLNYQECTAYVFEINLEYTDIKYWRAWLDSTPAYYKADIAVILQGEKKEFTFEEFFGRLGFDTEYFNKRESK